MFRNLNINIDSRIKVERYRIQIALGDMDQRVATKVFDLFKKSFNVLIQSVTFD